MASKPSDTRSMVLRLVLAGAAITVVAVGASAALDRPSRSSSTTTVVQAPREKVWRLVVDFDAYPEWNPYLRSVQGRPAAGSTLEVRLEPRAGDAQDVSASVTVFKPPRKLRWRSRLLGPGVRDFEYEVIVDPLGPNRARVTQRARYEGWLTLLVDADDTRAGLEEMARALKLRAESNA
jgi:hypothetical protein